MFLLLIVYTIITQKWSHDQVQFLTSRRSLSSTFALWRTKVHQFRAVRGLVTVMQHRRVHHQLINWKNNTLARFVNTLRHQLFINIYCILLHNITISDGIIGPCVSFTKQPSKGVFKVWTVSLVYIISPFHICYSTYYVIYMFICVFLCSPSVGYVKYIYIYIYDNDRKLTKHNHIALCHKFKK